MKSLFTISAIVIAAVIGLAGVTAADAQCVSFYGTDEGSCGLVCFTPYASSCGEPCSPYTYTWYFGDGGNSDAYAPCHNYATPGTYTVSLFVYFDGCGEVYHTTTVTVSTGDIAAYTGVVSLNAMVLCTGDTTTASDSGAIGGTWSSSNTAVATVSATGLVTAVSGGMTNIIYSISGCTGVVSTSVTLTVNPIPNPGTITGITTVCGGATTHLSDAVAGGVWSSAATSIATVDGSGNVTGVSGGIATISYTVTSGCSASATAVVTVNGVPTITSVSPSVGYPASAVTITGSGFNTIAANDVVYFGATRATVTAASSTSLSVTVPTGATYQFVTVDNLGCNLTSYSEYPFLPDYNNSGDAPGSVNFDPYVDFTAGSYPCGVAIGDIDGDGKPDLVVSNSEGSSISVFRNISTSGSITSGSFASPVVFATGSSPYNVVISDIDGDGKPDIIVANYYSSSVSVLRNTSTIGSITTGSFATHVDFSTPGAYCVAVGDIDGDGKPDLVVGSETGTSIFILHNIGSSGSITAGSFAAPVSFTSATGSGGIAISDIDGDGKPDIVVTNNSPSTFSVFRNTSTIGTINTGSLAAKVDFSTDAAPYGLAIGDIDGDGKPDVVVGYDGTAYDVSVFRNTSSSGSVSFAAKVDFGTIPLDHAYFIAIGDVDGDGKPDIAINGYSPGAVSVFRNTSTIGSITTGTRADFYLSGADAANFIVMGDLDGDGKPDLVTANTNGTVSVLRNDPLTAITGTLTLCGGGGTTTLSDVPGGTWTSGNTAVATVGSATGIVTGVAGGTATISYTLGGASVTAVVTVNGAPVITTVNPLVGYPASAVTITGGGFNTTAANDVVYFGATRATVTAASSTSISVTVPTGATYQFVTVDNLGCNLTSYSEHPFLPDYNNSGDAAGSVNFDPYVDFAAEAIPEVVAIGDIDGDGNPDLIVTNQLSNTVSVYRNISTSGSITAGSFAARVDFVTGNQPQFVAIGDIDGDGKPDLVVTNGGANTLSVYRNTSTTGSITVSSFAAKVDFATSSQTSGIAIGDINGDGKPDLIVPNLLSNTVSIFQNTGSVGSITSSSFATKVDFATGNGPSGVAVGDIDGDGKPDVAVPNNGSNTVSVFHNTSTGGSITISSLASKVDFATGAAPSNIVMGDIDGDGKPDITVCNNTSNTISVFRNTSTIGSITTGSFAAKVDFITGTTPGNIGIGDIDGDGKPDIAVNNVGANSISVFRNISTPGSITTSSFAAKVDFATEAFPRSIAIGDLDGDGKADIAATINSGVVTVLRNDPLIPITGTLTLCGGGGTTTLSDVPGGVWSSGSTAVATVGSATGIVTGAGGGTATISYTLGGASVTAVVTVSGAPIITTVNPLVGYPASAVTITGSGFNSTAANDVVYFGATRATVTAASSTSLSVTVPVGATYQFVTVDNLGCNLTSYSEYPFLPDYNNSGDAPGSVNFDPYVDFAADAGGIPESIAIGDIDGDGKPDIVVANASSNTVSVYRNISTSGSITPGSFAATVDFTIGSYPIWVAIGDIDGDGKPDLVIANEVSQSISVLRNTSTAGSITTSSFAARVDFPVSNTIYCVAIGDLDGDGKPDLVVPSFGTNYVSVFRNTGSVGSITSGSFATPVNFVCGIGSTSDPLNVTIGDLDGDGKPDIAVTNQNVVNTVGVLRNTSSAGVINFNTHVDFATGNLPSGVAIGDIDGDGKPELVVANSGSNSIYVYHNMSSVGSINTSSFAAPVSFTTGSVPNIVAIGDIDGDGKPDIGVESGNSYSVSIFRNTSTSGSITTSSLAAKVDFPVANNCQGIAIGDLDGDGKPDIAAANGVSHTISVLRNDPLTAITGTLTLCGGGGTTTLSDVPGGVWISGNTAVATVGSATGIVTGAGGGTATISYTLGGASVTAVVTVNGAPIINTVNPLVGYPASAVTITGSGFNTTAANDVVYFGATRATVTAASSTSLSVTVPTGATYQFVTVDNLGCNLTSYSEYPFLPDYNNSGDAPGGVNFDPKVDFTLAADSQPWGVAIGDIDGDGKPDIVVVNELANTISVYRNISTSGSITAGSFAARVDFATFTQPESVTIGDIDGDGKPDVVIGGSVTISVFRNTSTSGSITASSFATRVDFTDAGSDVASIAISDIDGDGKPDIVAAYSAAAASFSVFRNIGSTGTISFATKVDFTGVGGAQSIAVGDIDGDGKPDVAATNYGSSSVSVFHNASSIGSISFTTHVDFVTAVEPDGVTIGDIDGDGKPEIEVAANGGVCVFHNTSSVGSITTSSFASSVTFSDGGTPGFLAIGDIDGDGKPDLAIANYAGNVSVLRNTSTIGSITASSFATHVDFATPDAWGIAVGDIDGDGKADLAVINVSTSYNTVSIFRNDPLTAITGTLTLCGGAGTTTLSDVPGGTWSSGNTAVATVGSATGIVTGVAGGTATISYTLGGASVTAVVTVNGAPIITTVNPLVGYPASAVTITGSGFNTTAANDVVYFGATRATVTAASSTSLSVTVPVGATYQFVTVDNLGCNLTSSSEYPFLPDYNNSGDAPGSVNFDPYVNFAADAGGNAESVAIGDIDGDGKPDVVVVNVSTATVSVYRNTSTSGSITPGSFAAKVDFTTGNDPNWVAIGDIDGDGKPDLVINNLVDHTVSVLRNTSTTGSITTGSFAVKVDFSVTGNAYCVAIGDLDGDGKPDIVVPNYGSSTISVLHNTGSVGSITTGSFAAPVNFVCGTSFNSGPYNVAIGDLDGDGKPDIAVTNSNIVNTIGVLHNTSSPGSITSSSFAAHVDFATGSQPSGVVIGDIDGDGKPELVVTNLGSNNISVFHNTSTIGSITTGSFAAQVNFTTGNNPEVIAIGDLNGDGKPDLAVSNFNTDSISVFLNTSTSGSITTGSLAAQVYFTTGNKPWGIAVGDLDGDGKPDIAVANWGGSSMLVLRNDPLTAITGTLTLCGGGGTTTLSDVPGGTWTSGNTAVATVGATTGVVTGVGSGTATISYTLSGTSVTAVVTVTGLPSAGTITGASTVCVGATTTLSDATAGGTWYGATPTIGESYGGGIVAYLLQPGDPGYNASIPQGLIIAPSDQSSGIQWGCSGSITIGTSTAIGSGAANTALIVSTCGTGTAAYLCHTLTLGGYSDWYLPSRDELNEVYANIGSTGGGGFSYSTIYTLYWSSSQENPGHSYVQYFLPGGGLGSGIGYQSNSSDMLVRAMRSFSASYPTWSSSNTAIATVNPSGIVTGVATGTATISYTVSNGLCSATTTQVITVNTTPTVNAITASTPVCQTAMITLSDATTGGTWSSGNTSIATVAGSTGVVTGVAGGTATISYLVTNTCGTNTVTATVTVNPLPNPGTITGSSSVCPGGNITLSDVVTGGVWSCSATGIATVGTSGIVTGVTAGGTTTISYAVTNGCGTEWATTIVTVSATANAGSITGATTVCQGSATPLTDLVTGGVWSSTAIGTGTVGTSGIVTGIAAGTTTISYTVTNGCGAVAATQVVTVNPLPVAGTITGTDIVCVNASTPLTDAATSGVWSSTNITAGTVGVTGIVTGVAAGTTTISYTVTNGCGTVTATSIVTVNPLPVNPAGITGTPVVCAGGATTSLTDVTAGGTWTSTNATSGTVNTSGIVTGINAGTTTISYTYTNSCGSLAATTVVTVNTVPTVSAITGSVPICPTATISLTDATSGGTWSSGNIGTATVVGSTGVVTGVAGGTATISYAVTNACGTTTVTATVTVNPLPNPGTIAGSSSVCPGGNITLSDVVSAGVWSSSNTSVATVGTSGIVTGITAGGTATISYAVTNSCATEWATRVVTVNLTANAGTITGTATVCQAATTPLTDAVTGGVWSSTASGTGTVSTTGIVTGIAAGTTTISYTVSNGCGAVAATQVVTVNPLPVAGTVTGTDIVCVNASTPLTDATTGGVWGSTNTTSGTVGATGIVVGVAAGTTTISYTVTNGCGVAAATSVVTVNPLPVNPAGITGTAVVCAGGATTSLTDITAGGVWSSTNTVGGTVNTTGIVTGINAGTTTISYTYTNSCGSLAATTVVTVNPLPINPAAITGTALICAGGAMTVLTDVTGGGVWSSTNVTSGTVNASGTVTGIAAGTTTISYTYTNSCGSLAATTIVTVNPLPINPAGITGTAVVCAGGATTALSDITSGGVWSSTNSVSGTVNTSGTVTGITAGTTTISYTYTNSCGSLAATTIVTVNPLPINPAGITGTAVVCAGGSITALSDITSGGVWSSTNAASGSVDGSGNVTGISAGTTTISYTYTNSCGSEAATVIATVNPLPLNPAAITGTTVVCAGGAMTPLSDVTTGGTWSSTNMATGTVGATGIVTGIASGTTTISYTYTNSCGSLATTTIVSVNPLPINPAGITGTTVVCAGGSITSLSDITTGGTWTSTHTASGTVDGSGNVTGIVTGTTTISYTYTNSCGSLSATAIVTVNPLPIDPLGITGVTVVCENSTTSLSDITAGGTWSSTNAAAGTVSASGIVTGVATGTTEVSYTYTNSCGSLAATTVVTVKPLPITPAGITGTPMVCAEASTILTDVTAGGVWSSTNAASGSVDGSGNVTGIAAGTTKISYTYSNSCGSEAATVIVTVDPLPNAATITGTLIVCASSSTVLSDASTGGVWESANTSVGTFGTTAGLITGVSAGTTLISYTVTNSCGSATATKILTVNPLPTVPASITGTLTVCAGSTTALSDVTGGGVWSSTDLAAGTVNTTGIVTSIAAGTTTLSYTYTNSCGSQAATVVVTVNPLPDAGAIAGTLIVCASASTTLSDVATDGVWSSVNTAVATVGTGGVVTGVSAGTSLISYSATNSCGSAAVTKTITVNPLPLVPAAIAGTMILCQGTNTMLSDAVAGGTWSSTNTTIAGIGVTGVLSGLSPGTATINYTFTNSCGSNVASTTVTINPLSTPINGSLSVCTGLITILTDGTGGGAWSSSNIAVATVGSGTGVVTGVSSGNATITYTLPAGCATIAVITVNTSPAAITGSLSICVGSTTILNNDTTGGIWSIGTTTIATIGSGSGDVTSILAGESIISYTLSTGCSATAVLTVNPLPLSIAGPGSVCTGSSVTLSDAGGGSWSSSNSDVAVGSSGSVSGVTPGTSVITYTLPAGCITTTVMTVNLAVVPSVNLLSGSGDTVCSGTSVLFTAMPLNGGTAPAYQWQINSTVTAATSNTYSYVPSNGDIVKVMLTSNAVCATPAAVTAKDTITVIETDTAKVSISVTPGDSICFGTPVLFTADAINGGSDPVYLWFRNGIQQIVPGALYGLIPANNDNVFCELVSNKRCIATDTTISNHIIMTADSSHIPSVVITASQGNILHPDETDTFTAIVTNGGPVVTYQWVINYSVVPGATSDVFIWRGFSNSDSVTCEVTNVSICDYSSFNSIVIHNVPEGIQQSAAKADVRLIPNPNKGQFTINGSLGSNDEQASIEITDMFGQVIYKNNVEAQNGNINERILLYNTLANGMYMLNLNSANYHKVFHFVIEQ